MLTISKRIWSNLAKAAGKTQLNSSYAINLSEFAGNRDTDHDEKFLVDFGPYKSGCNELLCFAGPRVALRVQREREIQRVFTPQERKVVEFQ